MRGFVSSARGTAASGSAPPTVPAASFGTLGSGPPGLTTPGLRAEAPRQYDSDPLRPPARAGRARQLRAGRLLSVGSAGRSHERADSSGDHNSGRASRPRLPAEPALAALGRSRSTPSRQPGGKPA